ncbi:MAG: hypothetical protein ACR2H1_07645 [Limisphaerales bacterium]
MNPSQKFFEEGELLVLPDGKILAHNIMPEMAAVLSELDPENKLMKQRTAQSRSSAKRGVASASGGCEFPKKIDAPAGGRCFPNQKIK